MSDSFGYSPKVSVAPGEKQRMADFAAATVRAAGAATLPFFRQDIEIENKRSEGFDPVTEADKSAERIIRQRIEDEFPAHGILGEEFGHKPGNGLTWVIDPIDGTRAFMTGMLHWGVLLGLFDGDDVIVGAMYQPYADELFLGTGDLATFHRGAERRVLRTASVGDLSDAVLATTGPDWFPQADQPAFARLRAASRMCRFGGDCYLYGMVAMGYIHLGSDGSLNPYDIQALIPIIRGAGGVVTTYDGGNPSMGGTILASANERLHTAALLAINAD